MAVVNTRNKTRKNVAIHWSTFITRYYKCLKLTFRESNRCRLQQIFCRDLCKKVHVRLSLPQWEGLRIIMHSNPTQNKQRMQKKTTCLLSVTQIFCVSETAVIKPNTHQTEANDENIFLTQVESEVLWEPTWNKSLQNARRKLAAIVRATTQVAQMNALYLKVGFFPTSHKYFFWSRRNLLFCS